MKNKIGNSLQIITLERKGCWVFTDSIIGVIDEAFVGGMTEIIDKMLSREKKKKTGINFKTPTAIFSHIPFPDYDYILNHISSDETGMGNYYMFEKMKGWLCPVLLRYFAIPPEKIYIKFVK